MNVLTLNTHLARNLTRWPSVLSQSQKCPKHANTLNTLDISWKSVVSGQSTVGKGDKDIYYVK